VPDDVVACCHDLPGGEGLSEISLVGQPLRRYWLRDACYAAAMPCDALMPLMPLLLRLCHYTGALRYFATPIAGRHMAFPPHPGLFFRFSTSTSFSCHAAITRQQHAERDDATPCLSPLRAASAMAVAMERQLPRAQHTIASQRQHTRCAMPLFSCFVVSSLNFLLFAATFVRHYAEG